MQLQLSEVGHFLGDARPDAYSTLSRCCSMSAKAMVCSVNCDCDLHMPTSGTLRLVSNVPPIPHVGESSAPSKTGIGSKQSSEDYQAMMAQAFPVGALHSRCDSIFQTRARASTLSALQSRPSSHPVSCRSCASSSEASMSGAQDLHSQELPTRSLPVRRWLQRVAPALQRAIAG